MGTLESTMKNEYRPMKDDETWVKAHVISRNAQGTVTKLLTKICHTCYI